MRTYDPKLINLDVNGTIITGYAEGTFISVEPNEDRITPYEGADGEISVAFRGAETATMTLTLARTSPSVPYLNELARKRADAGMFSVAVTDLNSNGTSVSSESCVLMSAPTFEYSQEVNELEYTIYMEKFDFR